MHPIPIFAYFVKFVIHTKKFQMLRMWELKFSEQLFVLPFNVIVVFHTCCVFLNNECKSVPFCLHIPIIVIFVIHFQVMSILFYHIF